MPGDTIQIYVFMQRIIFMYLVIYQLHHFSTGYSRDSDTSAELNKEYLSDEKDYSSISTRN